MRDRKSGLGPKSGWHLWVLALAGVLVVLAFSNSPRGEFVYDDQYQIVENHLIRTPGALAKALVSDVWAFKGESGARSNYYRPGFVLWMGANYALFELEPEGWHVANLLAHLLAVWLAFLLLVRLGLPPPVVAASVWIFAVHPSRVESVTWIAGATDVLLACAFLGALLAYLVSRDDRRWTAQARGPLLCLLALSFKEIGATLVAVVFVAEWAFRRHEGSSLWPSIRRAAGVAAPYLGVVVAFVALRMLVLRHADLATHSNLGLSAVATSAPQVLAFYIRQTVYPLGLSPVYPLELITPATLSVARFWLPLVVVLVVAAGLVVLGRRRPSYALLAALFAAPLLPALDLRLFKFDQYLHDRYLYLPLLGIAALVFATLFALLRRVGERPAVGAVGALGLSLAMASGYATYSYNEAWMGPIPLWERAVDAAPNSAFALGQLSEAYRHAGRFDEAVAMGRRALESQPSFDSAHLVLGMALAKQGLYDEPKQHFQWVLENGGELEYATDQLGALESSMGNIDEAIAVFERGRELVPPSRLRYTLNIAVLQFQAGRAKAARASLESIRDELDSPNPDIARGWYLLGELYRIEGEAERARDCYRRYLETTSDGQGPGVAQTRAEVRSQLGL